MDTEPSGQSADLNAQCDALEARIRGIDRAVSVLVFLTILSVLAVVFLGYTSSEADLWIRILPPSAAVMLLFVAMIVLRLWESKLAVQLASLDEAARNAGQAKRT